jgi:succinyl-CoA synthetase beta subunit
MLNSQTQNILKAHQSLGWVLEPDAKQIMKLNGMVIPESIVTRDVDEAAGFLADMNTPVVAKAVSKKILHKTEFDAVVTGIAKTDDLKKAMAHLLALDGCSCVLIEKMIQGIELIVGAKNDYQFGPVIVLGIGGTAVEIYNDTAIRMAPLKPSDVSAMAQALKAKAFISGYRGKHGVNIDQLTHLMVRFSNLMMDAHEEIDAMDLNPVICTANQCVVADARIILPQR